MQARFARRLFYIGITHYAFRSSKFQPPSSDYGATSASKLQRSSKFQNSKLNDEFRSLLSSIYCATFWSDGQPYRQHQGVALARKNFCPEIPESVKSALPIRFVTALESVQFNRLVEVEIV